MGSLDCIASLVRTKRNRPVWSQDFGFQVSSKKALWRPQAVQRWCDSILRLSSTSRSNGTETVN